MQYEVIGLEHIKGNKKDGSGSFEFYRVHLVSVATQENDRTLGKTVLSVVLSPLPYANAKLGLGSIVGEPAFKQSSSSCLGFLPIE